MTSIRNMWCVLLAFVLAGCAVSSDSRRLDGNAPPIKDLAVIFGLGELSTKSVASPKERSFYQTQFPEGLMARFPAIFKANEVQLQRVTIQNKLITDSEIMPLLEMTKASHLLVVRPYSA